MEKITDNELIKEVVAGNTASFALLVKRYQGLAFQIAHKLIRSREEAEEITQDAFLKAYQHIAGFKGEAKFSTWLYRIVYTTAISRTRKKQLPTQQLEPENDQQAPVFIAESQNQLAALTAQEQKKYLNMALETLAGEEQLLINLFYDQELAIEEISQITSLTGSNIKVKLMRARRKLYTALHQELKHEISEIL